MNTKAIKTEEDYNRALQRLEKIFHSPINSPEGNEAETLSLLIDQYEERYYPIEIQ